jgi:hypothetical protein
MHNLTKLTRKVRVSSLLFAANCAPALRLEAIRAHDRMVSFAAAACDARRFSV